MNQNISQDIFPSSKPEIIVQNFFPSLNTVQFWNVRYSQVLDFVSDYTVAIFKVKYKKP